MALIKFKLKQAEESSSVNDNSELSNVKVAITRQWQIEDADQNIVLIPEDGGTVESLEFSVDSKRQLSFLQRLTWQQAIAIMVIFFGCLGGLIVLVADVLHGTMTFQIYLKYIVWLLAALGIKDLGKLFSKSSSQ